MDFAALKVNEISTLHLVNPLDGSPLEGAEIDLMGRDSQAFRTMVHEDARKQIAGKNTDPADTEAKSMERCCQLTVAIRGIEEHGKPITDPAELYAGYPWVFEQAQAFILQRKNFMKPT